MIDIYIAGLISRSLSAKKICHKYELEEVIWPKKSQLLPKSEELIKLQQRSNQYVLLFSDAGDSSWPFEDAKHSTWELEQGNT